MSKAGTSAVAVSGGRRVRDVKAEAKSEVVMEALKRVSRTGRREVGLGVNCKTIRAKVAT